MAKKTIMFQVSTHTFFAINLVSKLIPWPKNNKCGGGKSTSDREQGSGCMLTGQPCHFTYSSASLQ